MRIFHVATVQDWELARLNGTYQTSTYGRSLRQEGFIHAARREQVATVLDRYYADVSEPLVLLEIDTDLLDVAWHEDPVGDETYPHIYGPLPVRAVVGSRPARMSDIRVRQPVQVPSPPLTRAFQGLALVLGSGTAVLTVFAFAAHHKSTDGSLPATASFLLWALVTAGVVSAVSALAVADWLRRPSRTDTPSDAEPVR